MTLNVEMFSSPINIPAMPEAAVRILGIVPRDDNYSREIVSVIGSNAELAPRVLRLANSSLFCGSKQVSGLDGAVTVLGADTVKNIALCFAISDMFKTDCDERFDPNHFWRRSIVSAVACELIAKSIHFKSEETFLTAMIQDVGIAVMFTKNPDEYLQVLDEKLLTSLPVATVEKRVFGFDHQEVGSEILKAWEFPASTYMPIFYHHDTYNVPRELVAISAILRASDRISAIYFGTGSARCARDAREILLKSFGMNDERVSNLIDAVAQSSAEILPLFGYNVDQIKPFSEVLRDANEELAQVAMSQEMLWLEYKQTKEKAERLIAELKKTQGRTHDVGFRDGLTGLYNYHYFQEALGGEFARALRYKRVLGLVMLDIDHFREVNDTYGHQHGDIVLRTIGEEISMRMRKSDIVARYGGDKFALLLPETALSSAIATGEVCRAAIQKAIRAAGIETPITISVGATSFDPSNPVSLEDLIQAADDALYQAKQGGTDRVYA